MANSDFGSTTFTITRPGADFEYVDRYGTRRHVRTNDPLIFDDATKACEALDFLNEAIARGVIPNGDQRTTRAIERARKNCGVAPGGTLDVTSPPTPPPIEDPSTTGSDTAPPGGEESHETLNAPDPETHVNGDAERAPGEPSGEALAEDYYAPYPIPDYDLISILSSQGVPADQLDGALLSVIHNEPPPGLPHPRFGLDDRETPDTVADPVIIFTGQYSLSVTDVQIASRGFPLQLTRMYHSGPVYFGPWGYNWDHNYNVYLRELSDGGAAIWTGRLSEDVYKPAHDGSFETPVGVFRKLERQIATPLHPDRYVLSDREGMQHMFERPVGWPHPDRIPLVRIEDRHGNAHQVSYDPEGRLERVQDHAGRFIRLIYGDCALLEQVTDHTGRLWRYFHDAEIEHLIAVTTPATPEYPEGLTTCYEYDRFRRHPALLHNLTKVIDPAGRVVVENRYGEDPDTDDFGRVVYQEFGGFEATFHAIRLQYVPRTPNAMNVPALRVEVVDPGVLRVYTFNYRGDLLDERFRLILDGSYRLVARSYRYDGQGNLLELRHSNGLGLIAQFDDANPDPRARGNLLRLSLSAPPTRPAPGREIVRYTYEPRYQRIKGLRDESGAVTTFVYDYEVTAVDHGDIVRIDHTPVTLPDGTIQNSSEHFTYNPFGQLIERRSGEGHIFAYEYYDAGPAVGYLRQTVAGVGVENQSQGFGYDLYGNLGSVTQASGAVTEYDHNALGQLVGMRRPPVAGASGDVVYHYARDGRLKSQDTPRGAYQDGVIADPYIRHEFEFDALGHVRSVVYGANTASPRRWSFERMGEGFPTTIIDPLGRVTHREYDERNLLLHQVHFVGTPQERSVRFIYDRNGNLTRITDPAGRHVDYQYDAWDRLTEIQLPGVTGARTRVRYHYGTRDQMDRVETIGVPGPGVAPALLTQLEHQFDQRGRLVRRTQSSVSTVFWYDRDSCPVRVVDHRGHETSLTCDALGRTRQVTDAVGNQITYTYDAHGNLVAVDESEIVPGLAAPEIFHTALQYDARDRLIQLTDPLGNTVTAEYDDRGLLVTALSPLGIRSDYEYDLEGQLILARGFTGQPPLPVEHRWQRDLASRVTTYTDPEGKQTHYDYDLEDRWAKIVLPDGSVRQRIFDAAGQLVREVAPTSTTTEYTYGPDGLVERMRFIPGPPVIGLPDLQYDRDGLGRPVRLSQGGVTFDLHYDALDRLVSETLGGTTARWTFDDLNGQADLAYPDGRVDRYQLDALGRTSTVRLHQAAATPLTGAGLVPGAVLASYEYVGSQRLYRRVVGNGCETRYTYDQGRRLTGIEHRAAGGSLLALVQYVYDAAGRRRVMRADPAPGASALCEYDTTSRLFKMVEGFSTPTLPGSMNQAAADAYVLALGSPIAQRTYEFTLDHADGRNRSALTEAAGTTTDDYLLNDLHQITQLTRTTPLTAFTQPFAHDLDGHRIGDHRFTYRYDAMGRLREVRDSSGATLLLSQEFDPLGRVMRRDIPGGASERFRYLGARSLQDETVAGTPLRQRCFGTHIDELIVQSEGAERWGHQDARLSLLAVSDSAGVALERYSYMPFGMPAIWAPDGITPRAASSVAMSPAFGGHRLIGLNGLYDARARVYDADSGCFLQRDPRGYGDSANLYAYVSHNPVDLVDPTGEILPIIAAVVIIGALSGAGYSAYDAYHHPERYEGPFAWRAFLNVLGGAAIGGVSALVGEAVLATVGMGSLATGGGAVGGGTLTLTQTFVLGGTVSATSGLVWRSGFNGMFPEYVEPPSAGSMAFDYALGGGLGLGFRAVEAVGNPFSRSGWNTIRVNVAEGGARARLWGNRLVGNADRAEQIGRDIAELRVGRLHAGELQGVNVHRESVAYRVPGEGQRVVFNAELDAVTNSAWIQVKASAVPGRAARFNLAQAEYTAYGSPTGRSIYYVEPGRGYRNVVRDVLAAGVTEVRPLTPPLRGTEPFPLPFGGTLGIPATRLPWFLLTPDSTPPGGGMSTSK